MKIKHFSLIAVIGLAAGLFLAGCSGNAPDASALKELKPEEVLEQAFSALSTNALDTMPMYFSSDYDPAKTKKEITKIMAGKEIDKYIIAKKYARRGKATVYLPVVYRYMIHSTDKKGRETTRRQAVWALLILVNEKGVWKIRGAMPLTENNVKTYIVKYVPSFKATKEQLAQYLEYDMFTKLHRLTEKRLFDQCQVAVELTLLAEQLYFNDNSRNFTRSKEDLSRYIKDYNPGDCAMLDISGIHKTGKHGETYRITATTRNFTPCTLRAVADNELFPEKTENPKLEARSSKLEKKHDSFDSCWARRLAAK